MGKTQIQKDIRIFRKRIQKRFQPQKMLLFGSYVDGKATIYSDVDVVVIADAFKTIPFEKRLDILYPFTQDLIHDFHVFGYTQDEFAKISPLTSIYEAKTHSIELL